MKKKSLEIRALEALVEKMDAEIIALTEDREAIFETTAILREICSPHISEEIITKELDLRIKEIEESAKGGALEDAHKIRRLAQLKNYRAAIDEGIWEL